MLFRSALFANVSEFAYLGDLLHNPGTKNGWSPKCDDFDGAYKVLGLDSLTKAGSLSFANPKYTNESRRNGGDFIVEEGDFFISRGNTADLVALASVAGNMQDEDYIYPDLLIKLYVDTQKVDKDYLAFVFNSIFGRLYFKYAAKGKQSTMVKVSSEEVRRFLIPMVSLEKQKSLVTEIKRSLDGQHAIKTKIFQLRREIDLIVENLAEGTQEGCV